MSAPTSLPTLTTARLTLRPWREEDRAPFAALNADPRVATYLAGPLDRAQSDAMVDHIEAHFAERGFGLWAVTAREGGACVGCVGLWVPSFTAAFTPCVEVSWRLAFEVWGRGYATEAARAAIAHGFEVVGLAEIIAFTALVNWRSRAVMERLKMRRDPAEDFDHPRLAADHPLRRHVLHRLAAPSR